MKKIFLICILLYTINLKADIVKWLKIEMKSGKFLIENLSDDYDGDDDGIRIPNALYSDEYLQVIFSYQKKKLKEDGFKFLSHKNFKKKIKELFHIDIDKYKRKVLTCSIKGVVDNEFQGVLLTEFDKNVFQLFFIHKDGFVTESYRLPEIIDYKTLYPNICQYEKTIKEKNIIPWGCVDKKNDYQKEVDKNNKRTLYINQYLFNDDTTHLNEILKYHWLPIENRININNSTYKSSNHRASYPQ